MMKYMPSTVQNTILCGFKCSTGITYANCKILISNFCLVMCMQLYQILYVSSNAPYYHELNF